MAGRETTTNSYDGHVFFFTAAGNKKEEVARIKIEADTVLYPIRDEKLPAPSSVMEKSEREEAFGREYLKRTGIKWRHYFGDDGPRPPPVLNMVCA